MELSKQTSSALLSGVFIVLWSTAWIAGKFGLGSAGPMTLLFFRFAFAALVLFAIAFATRSRWPATLRSFSHIAIAGVLIQAFGLGGVYLGMHEGVSAGISSLLAGLSPLLTALGAAIFLNDRIGARHWIGLVLGLAGVGIVVVDRISLGAHWQGYALTFGGLISFVAGTLYQKKYCGSMDLQTGSFIQTLAAALVILIPAIVIESLRADWNATFVGAVAWKSLINSVAAMTLLMLLLSRGSASEVATLFYLVPPLTALMAFIAFHEALAPTTLIGFALVALSVYLGTRTAAPPVRDRSTSTARTRERDLRHETAVAVRTSE
jgi:drug/metabolite transporter (DMT)-like permease